MTLIPHYQRAGATLHAGDAADVLRALPAESVHCCVTSPPYWGLRDYGTGTWEGGDAACDHSPDKRGGRFAVPVSEKQSSNTGSGTASSRDCPCGAKRVDQQLGMEPTPEQFVERLVGVFREARRVLRDDGTVWINLGDSYSGGGRGGNPEHSPHQKQRTNNGSMSVRDVKRSPFKNKDLIGIPWMVAFALRADGWWLRQDIIWHKVNPMPESVRDRCTKVHEYVFMLSKSARYRYDAAAIAESSCAGDGRSQTRRAWELADAAGLTEDHLSALRACGIGDAGKTQVTQGGFGHNAEEVQALADEAKAALGGYTREFLIADTRNRRSVWTIPTRGYPGAHFAVFPDTLVEPCILAGCPEGGTVLDPFAGTGTTLAVAAKHGRRGVGIELSADYAELARRRIDEALDEHALFEEAAP